MLLGNHTALVVRCWAVAAVTQLTKYYSNTRTFVTADIVWHVVVLVYAFSCYAWQDTPILFVCKYFGAVCTQIILLHNVLFFCTQYTRSKACSKNEKWWKKLYEKIFLRAFHCREVFRVSRFQIYIFTQFIFPFFRPFFYCLISQCAPSLSNQHYCCYILLLLCTFWFCLFLFRIYFYFLFGLCVTWFGGFLFIIFTKYKKKLSGSIESKYIYENANKLGTERKKCEEKANIYRA